MLIIFTGYGKGKTTAALGQAMRAVGNGKKVLMVQFIKGPWKSGEDEGYKKLAPSFLIVKKGKGFVGIGNDTIPREVHEQAAAEALEYAEKEARSFSWDIIILDEIWNTLSLGLISSCAVSDFITTTTPLVEHIIMTGRDCPEAFIEKADLVTEMREVKHPFVVGIAGKKGVEF